MTPTQPQLTVMDILYASIW